MAKPEDIEQWAWDKAWNATPAGETTFPETVEIVARAILSAVEEEREACAMLADVYADVNWQECSDNILLDPVLSNRGRRPLTHADWSKAEDMATNSTIHSSMYHAAQNIASSIRNRKGY